MNNITKNRLIDSGWKEQRKINTDLIRKKYDEIGLEYPEVVDKFLKEYGMLLINYCIISPKMVILSYNFKLKE